MPLLTIEASADAGLRAGGLADTNFGGTTLLAIGLISGVERRAILRFPLTTVPTGATLHGVSVQLVCLSKNGVLPRIDAHLMDPVGGAWVELETTWNSRYTGTPWGTPGGDYNPTVEDSEVSFKEETVADWSLTAGSVASWVAAGFVDVLLKHSGGSGTMQIAFYSRENDESVTPKLQVIYSSGGGDFATHGWPVHGAK